MHCSLAHAFRTKLRPAIRRVVVLFVLMCLAFDPLAAAVKAHHVNDADAIVAMTDGSMQTIVATKKLPGHPASLPAADHDCHKCGTAIIDTPSDAASVVVPQLVEALPVHLVAGRAPVAEFRPPKA